MSHTIVGVLRGGPSEEHEVSLRSGTAVLNSLSPERYQTKDIYIDKEGAWHDRGRRSTPTRVLQSVDVVFNSLHGSYGEDGQVQKILEQHGVPYTGSSSFPSYLAMHKLMSKMRAKERGLMVPDHE